MKKTHLRALLVCALLSVTLFSCTKASLENDDPNAETTEVKKPKYQPPSNG